MRVLETTAGECWRLVLENLWRLLDPTGSYWVLLDPAGSCRILLEPTGSYRILLDPAGSYWILLDPTGSYCWTPAAGVLETPAGDYCRVLESTAGDYCWRVLELSSRAV